MWCEQGEGGWGRDVRMYHGMWGGGGGWRGRYKLSFKGLMVCGCLAAVPCGITVTRLMRCKTSDALQTFIFVLGEGGWNHVLYVGVGRMEGVHCTHTFLLVQLHKRVDVLWETYLAASPSKFLLRFHFHILSGTLPHLHTSHLHICTCVHTSTHISTRTLLSPPT